MKTAYENGRDAYEANLTYMDNPYVPGSSYHSEWRHGFSEASEKAQRELKWI